MRYIELTQGQRAIVDDADYEKLAKHKWCAHKRPEGWGFEAMRRAGCKCVRMHRSIVNAQRGQIVDHRNHQALDNRRENLRVCTSGENQHNRKPQAGTSHFKGVSWNKERRAWGAKIQSDRRRRFLGYFADEGAAACAYNEAARHLHGEFALLNDV